MTGLAEVQERLRATYEAVAATTVVTTDVKGEPVPGPMNRLGSPPGPRARRLVASAVLAAVTAGLVGAAIRNDDSSGDTQIVSQPTTSTLAALPATTCGPALPLPVDVPPEYAGPERVASPVEGQLALKWTSATGTIEARWPPDPEYRELGGQSPPTTDGQATVVGSGEIGAVRRTPDGSYARTIIFFLGNVPSECRVFQMDVIDTDRSRVDSGIAWLSQRGLVASNIPLVAHSQSGTVAPTVTPCAAPAGAVASPNRGGAASGATYPTPTEALRAFLDSSPSLPQGQYVEIRLPDASIVYARAQPTNPDSYVSVVHITPTSGGWTVDRWESSGC